MASCRHDDCACPAVETIERLLRLPIEEPYVLDSRRRAQERRLRRAGPRDHELRSTAAGERANYRFDALDGLQSADIEEVRARRIGLGGSGSRVGDEVGDADDSNERAEAIVQSLARSTRRDQRIELRKGTCDQVRAAPKLRWPAIRETAAPTRRTLAHAPLVLPENMRRADEPHLVCGVELDRGTESKGVGAAQQRRVVEVEHVEVGFQCVLERATIERRTSGQECRHGREPSRLAIDLDAPESATALSRHRHLRSPRKDAVRRGGVENGHLVSPEDERVRKPFHLDRIAAERERRVERAEHAKAKPLSRRAQAAACRIRSRSRRAVVSHESRDTIRRPSAASEALKSESVNTRSRHPARAPASLGSK